jgi:hypothetical protein
VTTAAITPAIIIRRGRRRGGPSSSSFEPSTGAETGAANATCPSKLRTRAWNAAVVVPPGSLVHCTARNFSGTRADASGVSSITTGNKKGWS